MSNVLSQYRKQKPAPKKRPSNTLSDFLNQALQGYWDRQGKLAQEGLTMADQGARQMREGDPSGALGMVGGPLSYLMSPVSALVPTGEEIDTARDLPEWSKPLARAASHTALLALPGPDLGPVASSVGNTARRIGDDAAIAFGAEVPEGVTVYGAGPILKKPGLGRGMADLAGDATDAELAALRARLEAEAAQTGTGAAPATRDQVNLTGGGAGQTPGPLLDRIKAGWGDHAATASWESELSALSKDEVVSLMRDLGMRPSGATTKTNGITAILGASSQAARDAEIAERIRRGQ